MYSRCYKTIDRPALRDPRRISSSSKSKSGRQSYPMRKISVVQGISKIVRTRHSKHWHTWDSASSLNQRMEDSQILISLSPIITQVSLCLHLQSMMMEVRSRSLFSKKRNCSFRRCQTKGINQPCFRRESPFSKERLIVELSQEWKRISTQHRTFHKPMDQPQVIWVSKATNLSSFPIRVPLILISEQTMRNMELKA